MKKFLSGLLSLVMVLSLTTTAFATDITIAGSDSEVPVELTQAASEFSVTVPTVLPVDVDADGVVTVATDNKIINNSWGAVQIKSVSVESLNDWTLVEFDTDFYTKAVGIKEYGLQLNEVNVATNGSADATTFDPIEGHSEISFTYDANIGARKNALSGEQIAQVIFVIGWYDGSGVIGGGSTGGSSTSSGPGLYEADGYKLLTWERSGIDVEVDCNSTQDTTHKTAGNYILKNYYPSITKIVLDEGVTRIGNYNFAGCKSLTHVVISDSVTEIGMRAFIACPNVNTVELGAGLTSTGKFAFEQCHALTSIEIPSNITVIDNGSFCYTGLVSVVIPNSVTTIGGQAFSQCEDLTSIVIPKSVTNIGNYAFDGVGSFNLLYEGSEEDWANVTKGENWIRSAGPTITYNYQG